MLAGQENRVEEQGEWRIGRGKDTYAGILGYIFYFMQPQMLSFFVFSLSRFCIDNHVTHSAPRRLSRFCIDNHVTHSAPRRRS